MPAGSTPLLPGQRVGYAKGSFGGLEFERAFAKNAFRRPIGGLDLKKAPLEALSSKELLQKNAFCRPVSGSDLQKAPSEALSLKGLWSRPYNGVNLKE